MAGLTAGHYCGLEASRLFQILYSSARKAQGSREKMSAPLIIASGGLVSPPPSSPGIDSWSENSAASYQEHDTCVLTSPPGASGPLGI